MLSAFKSYDIRGIVPDELNTELAFKIGQAYAAQFCPRKVVVGYDIRLESPVLAEAVRAGLLGSGVDVLDIGQCGTEEVYFASFSGAAAGVDGGIMITASHNPKGHNGMKFVGKGGRPISKDNGLWAMRDRITAGDFATSGQAGLLERNTDKSPYVRHLLSYVDVDALKPLKIVADPGNGAAGPVLEQLCGYLPFELVTINSAPDGNFPNGVPNPLLPGMRDITSAAVIENKADIGVAWDGDFDRCFFFDDKGCFIEGYYVVGLLAQFLLAKNPGARIVHDPRLVWNTTDLVKKSGGEPVLCRTGHAFFKQEMRNADALYGGEMSAHHYFRNFAYCDSGMIPWLLVAQLMSLSGKPLRELVGARMSLFPCSGELNFTVRDADATILRIADHFEQQSPLIDRTDGLSLEFSDWRFNIRASNTEPLLRLNVETAGDEVLLAQQVRVLKDLIADPATDS